MNNLLSYNEARQETTHTRFKSMDREELEIGEIWICLASLKANYLNKLNTNKLRFIEY